MRIKHYIVTYNNEPMLDRAVRSILRTPTSHLREISIINNHSHFHLAPDLLQQVQVLHNQARPDFSTGHLARNWNQALLHGFASLHDPHADLVVCSQNDAAFRPGYLDALLRAHQTLDLITYGDGDNCVSYTPRAVRRVGLWDERFCNIGYQEADYFLRAALYLGDRCSINDPFHGRVHNPANPPVCEDTTSGYRRGDAHHKASAPFHAWSLQVFRRKWNVEPERWPAGIAEGARQTLESFVMYPYFEDAVETLAEQQYLLPAA